MKQVMGATVTRFLRPVTYRRDSAAPAGNTMHRCLLPRAADNAVFRSAAKDQSQLSPLRRVDPVNTGRVLGPARSHEVPRVCGDLGKLDDLLGALEQRHNPSLFLVCDQQ
jgi:hypothetical protein